MLYLIAFVFALALSMTVAGITAPFAVLFAKAGLIPVPSHIVERRDHAAAFKWAIITAAMLTALVAAGAMMWWIWIVLPDAHVRIPYVLKYTDATCLLIYNRSCESGGVNGVIQADAFSYFLATTAFLYQRASSRFAEARHPIRSKIVPALAGTFVFLVNLHYSDFIEVAYSGNAFQVADLAKHVVLDDILWLPRLAFSSEHLSVQDVISRELASISGSPYKLASLYPRIVFLIIGVGLLEALFHSK